MELQNRASRISSAPNGDDDVIGYSLAPIDLTAESDDTAVVVVVGGGGGGSQAISREEIQLVCNFVYWISTNYW